MQDAPHATCISLVVGFCWNRSPEPSHSRAAAIDQKQQHDDEEHTGNNSDNRYIVHVNFSFSYWLKYL